MNKYKRLFNDSLAYMIGNFGSKLVSLIMVSFYTYTLSSSEYGTLDVVQTTIYMLIPLVSCCIHEAMLTFLIKKEYGSKQIFTNGCLVYIFNTFFFVSIALGCYCISLNVNIKWVVMLVVLEGFNTILLQYCRAIDKTKIYAISGIMVTFIVSIMNICFLKHLQMGLVGYYLSMVIAYIVSIIILLIGSKGYNDIDFSCTDFQIVKKMLKFAIPLIPNSLMWWGMNMLDKYVILYCMGSEYNGIYAVAGKIPTILTTLSNIFIQAWQVSAIREYDSQDKDKFYSKIFDGLLFFNVFSFSAIMIVLKPVLTIAINSDYTNVWFYVPFLLLGTVFSSLSAFLEANYHATKKTKKMLVSSITGLLLNLVLNLLFVNFIGLNGAAIATAFSFAMIYLIRLRDSKQFVNIEFDIRRNLFYVFFIAIEILVVYYAGIIITTIICTGITFIILYQNKNVWRALFAEFR